MAIALLEIPVSGWTCFNTERRGQISSKIERRLKRTLVDVRRVSLFSGFLSLLLLAISGRTLRRGLLGSDFAFGFGRGFGGGARGRSFTSSGSGLTIKVSIAQVDSMIQQLTLGAIVESDKAMER